jgi:hypothetical protein
MAASTGGSTGQPNPQESTIIYDETTNGTLTSMELGTTAKTSHSIGIFLLYMMGETSQEMQRGLQIGQHRVKPHLGTAATPILASTATTRSVSGLETMTIHQSVYVVPG